MDADQDHSVSDESASVSEQCFLQMRNYFSGQHLWSAIDFSDAVRRIEEAGGDSAAVFYPHRGAVFSCILAAGCFLESAINEFLQDVVDKQIQHLPDASVQSVCELWERAEGKDRGKFGNPLAKYCETAPIFGFTLEKGTSPYQDVADLMSLRNTLVHYKPKTVSVNSEHELTERLLKRKFPPNKLVGNSPYQPFFPDKCLGYGCTQWAVRSVVDFTGQFFDKIPTVPEYASRGRTRTYILSLTRVEIDPKDLEELRASAD
jgi:hypothetical protein